MAGKLYVVGTPIGNLSDFSPRAVDTLANVDFIAAEDTRVTVKLLNHFGIKKPLISYYEHNKTNRGNDIIDRLLAGEICALVSDAGMPAISDPGEDLVRMCHENNIAVESVPGPSALTTALAIAGMKTGRFCFEGFLSVNKPSRKAHLEELVKEKRTMVFYEAPHKLIPTLQDMQTYFGDRNIALVRELTKLHEEVIHTTFKEAIEMYSGEKSPKGEFVLIVSGYEEKEGDKTYSIEEAVKIAKDYIADGNSASSAAKMAAADTGIRKNDIYRLLNT
ncbi:MAG: 16S rRNA (cytidine(1402)-2'-O)-methyltransferase [Clostridia bacterium]|nr:16S rRNA (cytidine(1402)-2'-O)-methyltransferase [Clostridia bacterium]